MGKCKHHPQDASPGEGFCSRCLQKKLNSVWRGESDGGAAVKSLRESAASGTIGKHPDSSLQAKEAIAVVGSIASITKRKHSSKRAALAEGRDITEVGMDFVLDSRYADGVPSFRKPVLHPSSDIIRGDHARTNVDGSATKDWIKRRSKVSSLVSKKVVGNSVALADTKSGLNAFSSARSVRCRSLPLVDRIAKETALRVIKEVGDDMSEGDDILLETHMKEQDPRIAFFSPSRWRSKWGLKGLGSPMTGSNKIFPSRSVENVQKMLQAHFNPVREDSRFVCAGDVDRQRRYLQQASDHKPSPQLNSELKSEFSDNIVIEGMPDRILKPEDMNQRLRTSYDTVLQWLQDLPIPETPLQNIGAGEFDPYLSSSSVMEIRSNGAFPEDLAKVGHLHEIAEEHERLDESSVEEVPSSGNHFRDVSSFGKFLIRAAQRKPKQGLSRVASAR